MANPYHDETGKFCSKGEMLAAITRVAKSGDLDAFINLMDDYDDRIRADEKEKILANFVEAQLVIEYKNNAKNWLLGGKLHRADGPAQEYDDGSKKWYINGKLHRTDGPAVEYADGTKNGMLTDKFIVLTVQLKNTLLEQNNGFTREGYIVLMAQLWSLLTEPKNGI